MRAGMSPTVTGCLQAALVIGGQASRRTSVQISGVNSLLRKRLSSSDAIAEKKSRAAKERIISGRTQPAQPSHPYLERKQIQPHDTHVTGDGRLIIPIFSNTAELVNLQYIDADGKKAVPQGR